MSGSGRRPPRWLPPILVRAIHADQLRRHGGGLGLRDPALLDSALVRPVNRWSYDEAADLHDLAASCGFGLARNHPFVDGNKRVAFQAMYVFLGLNGVRIVAAEPEVVELVVCLAAGEVGEPELAEWLRAHTRKRKTGE